MLPLPPILGLPGLALTLLRPVRECGVVARDIVARREGGDGVVPAGFVPREEEVGVRGAAVGGPVVAVFLCVMSAR